MKERLRYVGMDLHKLTITIALADEAEENPKC